MNSTPLTLRRAPPENPTHVPWSPWVGELDASPEWVLTGYARSKEFKALFDAEGLTSFTSDHQKNPATTKIFEPAGGKGGPVVGALHFDERAEGAPACTHEGAVGACLDSLLGFCNLVNDAGGPTLNLTLRFLRPVPLMACVRADAQMNGFERNKIFLKGSVVDGTDSNIIYAECDGLWFNAWGKSAPKPTSLTGSVITVPDAAQFAEVIRGLRAKHPALNLQESRVKVMDTPWVAELAAKEGLSNCTELIARGSGSERGSSFVTNSQRIKVEYFVSSSEFIGAFLVSGECMGPPPNIHGGCIFSLHADSVISCMKLRAKAMGVTADKCSLKMLSVNFRKLTPLWLTYAVRVHIVSHTHDVASGCWRFCLKSEMVNPANGVLHSDATSEVECDARGIYQLLPRELTNYELMRPSTSSPISAL